MTRTNWTIPRRNRWAASSRSGARRTTFCCLTALTTDKVIKWRLTLPFRSGDSSSLSVHWSVISGFFSWAAGMGYIEKSPIPNPKTNPQFRIRYEKAEVKPPTKKQVEKILAILPRGKSGSCAY